MTEYYFDIETYSTTEKPDLLNDKIITIQFQKLSRDGGPNGDLQILTEWDCGSEKEMLDRFRKIFFSGSDFSFIPIGMNLYGFDLISLIYRLNHHFDLNLSMELFRTRPVIDIKTTLILINDGQFKGYNLILGKKQPGSVIQTYYENKDYNKIIEYIKDETANFIKKYQILRKQVPKLREALA